MSNAALIEKARLALELQETSAKYGPNTYGPDSYSDSCQCAVCDFMRAATPAAVLALVTVGQRDQDVRPATANAAGGSDGEGQ